MQMEDTHMAKFNLDPDTVLEESIRTFIAKVFDSFSTKKDGLTDEKPKTLTNEPSSDCNKLESISESMKQALKKETFSRNDSSSPIITTNKIYADGGDSSDDDNDADIEIIEIEENSSTCMQDSGEKDRCSQLNLENDGRCEQPKYVNETLKKDSPILDFRDKIRDAIGTFDEQMSSSSILSKSHAATDIHFTKEDEGDALKYNKQLEYSCVSKNAQSPENQVLTNSVNAVTLNPISITKTDPNQQNDILHNLLNDKEWNEKNVKLIGINLEQNEDVFLNKQESPVQNDSNSPATIIPSIPVAHGFKRYTSYTSTEHLEYLHELALSKLDELKGHTASDSCASLDTPEETFQENKVAMNCSKTEAHQKLEMTAKSTVAEDTYSKNNCHNTTEENWNTQGMRNSSLLGCQGMIDLRSPISTTNEENTSACSGYHISKIKSYAVHSLPKTNSVPIPLLAPPLPPQTLSSSSSSSSSFTIARPMPQKHVITSDGQEWIMKLPENRKPMESMWPSYRSVYKPYTVYDSRFMQRRVRLSQRPVMIAQPQSTMNPCLVQSHSYVNQYGDRIWGIYSPIAHRIFPRKTIDTAQQRMPTASPDVVPHFIPHPTQRMNTNHPVFLSQLSKMSPDVKSEYTPHPPEDKCKSLEEIVGRIKENNKQ